MTKKTKEEMQAAVDEIAEVCRKHGVFLVGHTADTAWAAAIVVVEEDHVLCTMDGGVALEDVSNIVTEFEGNFRVASIG